MAHEKAPYLGNLIFKIICSVLCQMRTMFDCFLWTLIKNLDATCIFVETRLFRKSTWGVLPSAWNSNCRVNQLGSSTSLGCHSVKTIVSDMYIWTRLVFSTWNVSDEIFTTYITDPYAFVLWNRPEGSAAVMFKYSWYSIKIVFVLSDVHN